jgi:hypothetical protein
MESEDFKVPVLDGDFASERDSQKHVARSMTIMSREERDRVLNDLHGVSAEIEETPALLERNLLLFEQEVQRLKSSEAALALALKRNVAYVDNIKIRLQFLRCDSFDAKAAAERFARHFKMKLELFGEDKLTKDIIQDDLDEETMEYLYSGRYQNLPLRDKSGRHVSLFITKLNSYSAAKDISLVRCCFWRILLLNLLMPHYLYLCRPCLFHQMRRIFYSAMVNVDSLETQRKGMVLVLWALGNSNSGFRLSVNTPRKTAAVQRAVPCKIVGFHICYDTIFLKPILATFQLGCDLFAGIRFRSHYGK